MSDLVDPEQIEWLVGRDRHGTRHYGRADTASGGFYILHSQRCVETHEDLRECPYSLAMDKGYGPVWRDYVNRPIHLRITEDGKLVPQEERR